jgi:alanine dehydrogenase
MVSEEGMMNISSQLLPKEEMLAVEQKKSSLSIGVIAEYDDEENRVCLTPESVGLLVDHGHDVIVQKNAGAKSGFTDMAYSEQGGVIVDTLEEAMKARIILKVSPFNKKERSLLQKNHVLITSLQLLSQCKEYFGSIVESKATALAFEKIKDVTKAYPLIRSMSEIVGSTGIQLASYYLSHPKYGNGSMLGGIPGIKPSEIVIIGAGAVGEYAARVALGAGASVKIFDNSIYKLRRIQNNLQQNIFTSTLQPQTLLKALKDADVAIGALRVKDDVSYEKVPAYMVEAMKHGSVIIDVSIDQGGVFETSRPTTHKEPVYQEFGVTHYAVPNIASRVPFTASTALSNFFAPLILEMGESGSLSQFLKKNSGIRKGVYIFNGIVTNHHIGATYGFNYRDLDLLLAVLH